MNLPRHFCIAPFFQHTTHPSGSCSPCPYLGGTSWAQPGSTIQQQWSSPQLEDLRRQFLSGERPDLCHRCWHEEEHGKRSLRQRLFDPQTSKSDFDFAAAGAVQQRLENHAWQQGPRVLTIKNGNVCNAKCRVCHPNDSSRWIADARRIYDITGKRYYNLDQVESNWSDAQLQEILLLCNSITRLELFGGEPAYNKQVARLLSTIADRGLAAGMTLYVNTNGSVDILERMPAVKEFGVVEIGVSIDGVGAQFDYIRHGLDYDRVMTNVAAWRQWFESQGRRHSIDSISTVQILNVFYLPELRDAVKNVLPLTPFWNLLIEPSYLFIKNLPDHAKEVVLDKLAGDPDFDDIRSMIAQPSDTDAWQQFQEVTHALDQIRNESFAKTFPEWHGILYKTGG